MGIFRSTKRAAGRIIDVRVDRWMGWDYLRETADRFKILLLGIVVPQKASYAETFEEAMLRLDLTDQDILKRKEEFTRLFYFFNRSDCFNFNVCSLYRDERESHPQLDFILFGALLSDTSFSFSFLAFSNQIKKARLYTQRMAQFRPV